MWLDTQHGEMIQGSFDNGTVTGVAVWERQDGVRFEGVFRRGHAHGPGLVTWHGDGYRWAGGVVIQSFSDSEYKFQNVDRV